MEFKVELQELPSMILNLIPQDKIAIGFRLFLIEGRNIKSFHQTVGRIRTWLKGFNWSVFEIHLTTSLSKIPYSVFLYLVKNVVDSLLLPGEKSSDFYAKIGFFDELITVVQKLESAPWEVKAILSQYEKHEIEESILKIGSYLIEKKLNSNGLVILVHNLHLLDKESKQLIERLTTEHYSHPFVIFGIINSLEPWQAVLNHSQVYAFRIIDWEQQEKMKQQEKTENRKAPKIREIRIVEETPQKIEKLTLKREEGKMKGIKTITQDGREIFISDLAFRLASESKILYEYISQHGSL